MIITIIIDDVESCDFDFDGLLTFAKLINLVEKCFYDSLFWQKMDDKGRNDFINENIIFKIKKIGAQKKKK